MKLTLILCLTGLVPSPLYASRIFVANTLGSGVTLGELATAKALVRIAAGELGGNELVESPDEAEITLHPNLLRLGKAYVLGVEKRKNGRVLFSTELKSPQLEELDKVAREVTRAALAGNAAATGIADGPKEAKEIDLSEREARAAILSRQTRKLWYFGIGGASLGNLGTHGAAVSFAGAFNWDMNDVILQVLADAALRGSALFTSLSIGGHYLFSARDLAPFISADFGYGISKIDGGVFGGGSNAGFTAAVGAGLHLLHAASTSLELAARFGWLLHDNELGRPALAEMRLGLYF